MERDIEKVLKPCVSVVFSETYRRVLDRIVEIWSAGGSPSYYQLYKEGAVKSKNGLQIALNLLSGCCYTFPVIARPRTGSPIKPRIDYLPTPLGVATNLFLKLLYIDETLKILNLDGHGFEEFIKLLFYKVIPPLYQNLHGIYLSTAMLYRERKEIEGCFKGAMTALYIIFLINVDHESIALKSTENEPFEDFANVVEQNLKAIADSFNKGVKSALCYYENIVGGNIICRMANYLSNNYDLLLKSIEEVKKLRTSQTK
jgi:hypothetical protein